MEYLEPIARARALGTRYLESVGLPSAPFVRRFEPRGSWSGVWRRTGLTGLMKKDKQGRPPIEGRSLDVHIEALGYARDSLPDLAARLILTAANTEGAENGEDIGPGKERCKMLSFWYFELGQLIGLWGAYLKVADGRATRGKSKRKAWADAIAKRIREDHPYKTKDQLWEAIDDLGVITAGGEQWECYRDGNWLVAIRDYDGSEHKLAESGFKRRYLKGR